MANEVVHVDVGAGLTYDEYHAVTAHSFSGASAGMLPYAPSTTASLVGLPIGSSAQVLTVSTGTPALPVWQTAQTGVSDGTALLYAIIFGG